MGVCLEGADDTKPSVDKMPLYASIDIGITILYWGIAVLTNLSAPMLMGAILMLIITILYLGISAFMLRKIISEDTNYHENYIVVTLDYVKSVVSLPIAAIAAIMILCVFASDYPAITKANTQATATVLEIDNQETKTKLTIAYTDDNGDQKRAVLKVYGGAYTRGDEIAIRYCDYEPNLVCSANVTSDKSLSILQTSDVNPDIVKSGIEL